MLQTQSRNGRRYLYYVSDLDHITEVHMKDLSKYSIDQLRALEVQVVEELKTRHFLSVSQAREQILHIARNAGISVEQLAGVRAPKVAGASKVAVKF